MPVFVTKSCTILSTSRLSGSGDNSVIRVCAHALDEMASAIAATAIDETRCFTASSFFKLMIFASALSLRKDDTLRFLLASTLNYWSWRDEPRILQDSGF